MGSCDGLASGKRTAPKMEISHQYDGSQRLVRLRPRCWVLGCLEWPSVRGKSHIRVTKQGKGFRGQEGPVLEGGGRGGEETGDTGEQVKFWKKSLNYEGRFCILKFLKKYRRRVI